jgi:thymidine phosphorylase
VPSPNGGYVHSVDAHQIGMAMVGLGAGRRRPEQTIDHDVGISNTVHIGDRMERGAPLCVLHTRDESSFRIAAAAISAAITIASGAVDRSPVFAGRMASEASKFALN